MGNNWEQWPSLFSWAPKSLQMLTASMKVKDTCSLEEKWKKWKLLSLTLWDPTNYTVHGILQARILEWVAFPSSRGSFQPRDQTQVSRVAGGFFTSWVARVAEGWLSSLELGTLTRCSITGTESISPCYLLQQRSDEMDERGHRQEK